MIKYIECESAQFEILFSNSLSESLFQILLDSIENSWFKLQILVLNLIYSVKHKQILEFDALKKYFDSNLKSFLFDFRFLDSNSYFNFNNN